MITGNDTPDLATQLRIVTEQLALSEAFISDLCKELNVDELEKWDEWKTKNGIEF